MVTVIMRCATSVRNRAGSKEWRAMATSMRSSLLGARNPDMHQYMSIHLFISLFILLFICKHSRKHSNVHLKLLCLIFFTIWTQPVARFSAHLLFVNSYVSVHMFTQQYETVFPLVCLSTCMSIHMLISLSILLPSVPFICFCRSCCLSTRLSIYIYMSLHLSAYFSQSW